ncbi:MAG: B12-binding domain-containing radical SAM protein [Candidatus Methanomethyliaceae archaeon]|nr:B12-binding domain-containing radical SAM protein [Candidatus Methanomethyliaceae archaeon]
MRVLFIEPPKEIWFVMGDYLSPPLGILQLAAYLERKVEGLEVDVLDCNAQQIDWKGVEKSVASFNPDIVASSALATCNAYTVVRTLETAKRVNPNILTVAGGQHFTATAQESLETYPEIDVIVRGEGEETLAEVVRCASNYTQEICEMTKRFAQIRGISFRHEGRIFHNPPRPLIKNLEDLPYPGYHLVKDHMKKYHFAAMAGKGVPHALIEGSRGCFHSCTFCSQWSHWQGTFRAKSPKRIADEMEFCYNEFGSRFIWLTDDNFVFGRRAEELAEEIMKRGLSDELMWFTQARCDELVKNEGLLPKLRRSGLRWVLIGAESSRQSVLEAFKKGIKLQDIVGAVRALKKSDIFAHTMFIIGEREDTAESIAHLRGFVNELDPDMAIFGILTPFPGTELFKEAKRNGWIEDYNWSHYDMIHAIMPTKTLSRRQLQEELYLCYRDFFGSWDRRLHGLFSTNEMVRRIYWYMAFRGIIRRLRDLV